MPQSSASSELRQEIEVLLNPFSYVAISKQVIESLSSSGPLVGHVERYFYDKGKLKTSSIVNFGLVPLLKMQGTDSLFVKFNHIDKAKLNKGSASVLVDYIKFSVAQINMFLSAVHANVPAERWTTDPKVPRRLLTVTNINSFLITMRFLIQAGRSLQFAKVNAALNGFDKFDTKPFSSSQYNRMAEQIAKKYFGI